VTDWTLLRDDGKDPVPGDPDEVDALRNWFRRMGDQVADSVTAFQHFDVAAEWKDQAAATFAGHLDQLKSDLPKLRDSYSRAALGLSAYGSAMREAQQKARAALNMALDAKANVDSATRAKLAVPPDANTASYDQQATDGHDRLQQARGLAEEAHIEQEHAARACIAVLRDAGDVGMHNRSLWDKVGDALADPFVSAASWVNAHLKDLAEWCGKISAILSTVALICAFIPVLAPFAVGLEWFALGLSAAKLGFDAALLAEGRGTWTTVIADGAFVALSMGGVAARSVAKSALTGEAAAAESTIARVAPKVASQTETAAAARQTARLAEDAGAEGHVLGGYRAAATRAENRLAAMKDDLTTSRDVVFKEHLETDLKAAARNRLHDPVSNLELKYAPRQWHDLPSSVKWTRVEAGIGAIGHVNDLHDLARGPLPHTEGLKSVPAFPWEEGSTEGAAHGAGARP
jgi:hypothetical protein